MGADAVLVSGCHPGDCHYTAGNYHARRRWMLFRELLETLGIDTRAHPFLLDFGRRRQEVAAGHHRDHREDRANSGPYTAYRRDLPRPNAECIMHRRTARKHAGDCSTDGTVQVVIGYGQDRGRTARRRCPVFITRPEDADQLVWNDQLLRQPDDVSHAQGSRGAGQGGRSCVKGCDERALVVLEKESQIDRSQIVVIGLACDGVGQPRLPKCEACDVHMPRRADVVIGQAAGRRPPRAGRSPLRRRSKRS